MYTWGEGFNGKLGHGIISQMNRSCEDILEPKEVEDVTNIQSVGGGSTYTIALTEDLRLKIAGNLSHSKFWHKDDLVQVFNHL